MTDDIVARSDAFDERVAGSDVAASLAELTTYGERNRLLIKIVGGVVAVVLGLVATVGYLGWHDHQTARETSRAVATAHGAALDARAAAWKAQEAAALSLHNADVIRATCESLNASRRDTKALWESVIQLTAANPAPDQTTAQKRHNEEVTKVFLVQLEKVTRQRDCSKPNPFAEDPPAPAALPARPQLLKGEAWTISFSLPPAGG